MKTLRFLWLLCMFLPLSSFAQDIQDQPICRILADHQPRGDVAYKPGVDVRGKSVVSANLNGGSGGFGFNKEQPIRIPLQMDVLQRFNIAPAASGLNLEPDVGFIDVFPSGRVEINGRDVKDQAEDICSLARSMRPAKRVQTEVAPETNMPYPEDDRQTGGGPGVPVTNDTDHNISTTEIDEVKAKLPGRAVPLKPQHGQREWDGIDSDRNLDGVYYNE